MANYKLKSLMGTGGDTPETYKIAGTQTSAGQGVYSVGNHGIANIVSCDIQVKSFGGGTAADVVSRVSTGNTGVVSMTGGTKAITYDVIIRNF